MEQWIATTKDRKQFIPPPPGTLINLFDNKMDLLRPVIDALRSPSHYSDLQSGDEGALNPHSVFTIYKRACRSGDDVENYLRDFRLSNLYSIHYVN